MVDVGAGCGLRQGENDPLVQPSAVADLNQAIEDYNKAVLYRDTDPDSSRIDAAAQELRDVCTS